ncbi:DUF1353 domain-containing protein [Hymenobacter caeli]|uniref:DUF1353 domain-containing protein n=1 Tax=Hymenobacter caeli TaxID=2735894 RepID=A0ABX2FJD3_9BACT|nr:DUF1353 domain-containing protein [Hymenobacter caeli]NRT17230.1 hypothetical protein [Hymenobacter caeli]
MDPALGTFSEDPRADWLTEPDDRRMRLLRDFWYDDPAGRRWPAPAGSVVDGASIPAALWSAVGSPYTGPYRRASIVHDVACDTPAVPRADADKMFYQACRAGGCSAAYAELLYAGVRIGAHLPRVRLWAGAAARPQLARGAAPAALADESIRTTFWEIAADLDARRTTGTFASATAVADADSFAQVAAIVDRHLAAKARQ